MTMKIIAFTNQKGGVGKTTSCLTTGTILASSGKKTLLVDLDEQGSMTKTFNIDTDGKTTVYEVLRKEDSIQEGIVVAADTCKLNAPIIEKNLFVLPADRALGSIDMELSMTPGREYRLKEILAEVAEDFDYCLIDCPPKLGLLVTMALTACDYTVIPLEADIYSMEGLKGLSDTIELTKHYTNPNLKIAGILFTMFDPQLNLSKTMLEAGNVFAENRLDCTIFNTKIRSAVAVREAHAAKLPVVIYKTKAKPSIDYAHFTAELLERVEN